jgi:hypothetical protein
MDDIGIQATTDTGGGYNVGWLNNGEWLEYTVNPQDPSAIYSISVRVAAPAAGGQLRLRLNGAVLGTVSVPATGDWQNWQTVTLPNVPIQGGIGSQALRLEVLNDGFNINWVELDRVQICGTNDLALNQPASASSLESSSYPAADAFDENPTTRWSSAWSDPQWVQVDLGSVQNIAHVWLNWENASATAYSIQLSSDGNTWNTVYSTTNGPGSINDLAAVGSGRYVRMYGTQRATQYGYSLWEFEVFPALIPQLTISLNGTNRIVSWPNTVNSFSLQATPVLGAPSWSNVAMPPYMVNSEYIVTNSISGSSQFYRLYQNP